MEAFSMATSLRHNKLSSMFYTEIASRSRRLVEEGSLLIFTEEVALVHYGSMQVPDLRLVEIANIPDIRHFTDRTINELNHVQPDLFLFKNNAYIINERENRIAGFPDLVVEIWSESNDAWDRKQKFSLYSSSPITEHWYIEQDDNTVKCYIGNNELPDQSLKDILKTQGDIVVDITFLAL